MLQSVFVMLSTGWTVWIWWRCTVQAIPCGSHEYYSITKGYLWRLPEAVLGGWDLPLLYITENETPQKRSLRNYHRIESARVWNTYKHCDPTLDGAAAIERLLVLIPALNDASVMSRKCNYYSLMSNKLLLVPPIPHPPLGLLDSGPLLHWKQFSLFRNVCWHYCVIHYYK